MQTNLIALEGIDLFYMILLVVFISSSLRASPFIKTNDIFIPPTTDILGERLEYSISLNNISLGRQVITFESTINYEGRQCYVVSFKSQPNLGLKVLNYRNDELFYLDKETFLPLYTKREYGAAFSSGLMETYFRLKTNEIDISVSEKDNNRRFSVTVTEPFQGETTLILFSRYVDFSNSPVIEVFSSTGINYMQLTKGGQEEIKVPYGRFLADVLIITPDVGSVWFSSDSQRLPLKIILNIKAGKLEMNLLKVSKI